MEQVEYKRFKNIYPWFAALSGDLLFYVIIGDLFLSVVKGFSASQIVSLTSISLIVSLILQFPLLALIKKIGNTASLRVGSILLFISSLLLTFGGYFVAVLGKITYEVSFTLLSMCNVTLKNNSNLAGAGEDYIRINTNANTIYAAFTLVISLCASFIFNFNHYLAMLCSSFICIVSIVLAFFIKDYSKQDNIVTHKPNTRNKLKLSNILNLTIIVFMLFFPFVNSSQTNGSLFIQYELLDNFTVKKSAILLGVILFISRVARLVSNLIFNKLYNKIKHKISILYAVFFISALGLMVLSSFLNIDIVIKIVMMSIGYIAFLFIRDPIKVYLWNYAMNNAGNNSKQVIVIILDTARKFIRALLSSVFSIILIDHDMIVVMSILLAISVIPLALSIVLYIFIKRYDPEEFPTQESEIEQKQEI